VPASPEWIHRIKYDGYQLQHDGARLINAGNGLLSESRR